MTSCAECLLGPPANDVAQFITDLFVAHYNLVAKEIESNLIQQMIIPTIESFSQRYESTIGDVLGVSFEQLWSDVALFSGLEMTRRYAKP